MLEKLKWAYKLMRSRTFCVLLDKESAVSIPLMDINKFESQFLLSAQTASLKEFKSRLEDLIHEHDDAVRLLSHRESVKKKSQRKTSTRTSVSKAGKKA